MRRSPEAARRQLWQGFGDAWNLIADLLTATAVWAAVGYGLDRWLGTWPVIFVIGAFVGHGTGIYMVILRSRRYTARAARPEGELEQR